MLNLVIFAIWPDTVVGYTLRPSQTMDPEWQRETVERAFQAWSRLDCGDGQSSLTFSPGGPNQVVFEDDDWVGGTEANNLGKTTLHYRGGLITDGRVAINSAQNDFADGEYSLELVLTHEIGHFIGLGHSADPDSIMAADYARATARLSRSDIAAACAAYPPGRKSERGCGGAAVLFFPFLRRRRR